MVFFESNTKAQASSCQKHKHAWWIDKQKTVINLTRALWLHLCIHKYWAHNLGLAARLTNTVLGVQWQYRDWTNTTKYKWTLQANYSNTSLLHPKLSRHSPHTEGGWLHWKESHGAMEQAFPAWNRNRPHSPQWLYRWLCSIPTDIAGLDIGCK